MLTWDVSHLFPSVRLVRPEQESNRYDISLQDEVFQLDKFNWVRAEQSMNVAYRLPTLDVSHPDTSSWVRLWQL